MREARNDIRIMNILRVTYAFKEDGAKAAMKSGGEEKEEWVRAVKQYRSIIDYWGGRFPSIDDAESEVSNLEMICGLKKKPKTFLKLAAAALISSSIAAGIYAFNQYQEYIIEKNNQETIRKIIELRDKTIEYIKK